MFKMETNRLLTNLSDIEKRVEVLREQAILMQNERESLLELMQNLQDNTDISDIGDVDREEFDWQLERLILRCLTVDVAVATPRNEFQEDAFQKISDIIAELKTQMTKDPHLSEKQIESYLNASLPEPLSGNINQRFQEKLLGCTVDDQKGFRKKLQKMYIDVQKITRPVSLENGCESSVNESVNSEMHNEHKDDCESQGPTSADDGDT